MEQNTKKHPFWTKIHTIVHRHPHLTYAIAGASLLLASGFIVFAFAYEPPRKAIITPAAIQPATPAPEPIYYSPLTGNKVANKQIVDDPVTAIMIENSPAARPQSGLSQAGIVYEAIAEGGITRFLALYQQEKPQLIGPVRSLREYFVDWLAPFNASVVHVGGSKASLDEIRNGSYRDIDQFFNAASYWRASDRYAPHNVYTSFERLDALNKAKNFTSSSFTGFDRADGLPIKAPDATSIAITVSSAPFNSSYQYDAASNRYARSQGGAAHLDREEGQIRPSVIIAMNVDMKRVMEDGYRERITTSGSGKATIFQNGTVQVATWRKDGRRNQLTFVDSNGKSLALTRGQTWITAIPNKTGNVSWQ